MTFWWDSTDVICGSDQIKVFSASQILDRLLVRSPPYFLAFVGRAVGNTNTRGPLAAHPPLLSYTYTACRQMIVILIIASSSSNDSALVAFFFVQ